MKSRVLVLLLIASFAVISCVFADEQNATAAEESVLTLDHSNFEETISKHDFIVVEFYAPWCGHCKKLAPEYEKAASILKSHDPPISLAKVDANEAENKDLATKYDVKGFPTLIIFRNKGKSTQEYNGPRESDGIVEYLKSQTGPASTEIKSSDEGSKLTATKKISIVGIFSQFSGEEFDNFTQIAEKLRSDYTFHHSLDATHLPHGESSPSLPVVRLFKPFDELSVDSTDFDLIGLEKFVVESSMPMITQFDKDQSNHPYVVKFFNSPASKVMMFVNFSSDFISLKTKFEEAAKQHKAKDLIFLLGDTETGQGVFQYFGVKEEQVPLIIVQSSDSQKYLKPNVQPDDVSKWIIEFKEGKVSPYTRSQPIPEVNNEPVKVVVGDSLNDEFFKSGKNVLLEFYAPWCGHCKKLEPILEEVAVAYQNDADVVIAKLDATENDYPSDKFDIQGYPTMFFIDSSGKVSLYDGGRTKDDIISYIDKNRVKASDDSVVQTKPEADVKESKGADVKESKYADVKDSKDEL